MYCRNCGSVLISPTGSCSQCGASANTGSNYCPQCGHFCIPGDTRCIQCGTLLDQVELNIQQQARKVAQELGEDPGFMEPERININTGIGPKFLPDDKKYCRNCGLVIPANQQVCQFCESADGTNYCNKCGTGTTDTDTVCPACSTQLHRVSVNQIPRTPQPYRRTTQPSHNPYHRSSETNVYYETQSRNSNVVQDEKVGDKDFVVTLILNLAGLIGIFGLHRFYTGHILSGIVQLLTGGLCGIWWLIDLITIITGSYTDGNGRKLRK